MNSNYLLDVQSEAQLIKMCSGILTKPAQNWTIRLLPRTYILSQTIELPNSCAVLGQGSILKTSAPVGLLLGRNTTIQDLSIVGQNRSGIGISLKENASRSAYTNLRISNFGRGIFFNTNWCLSVNDCFISNCETCIEIAGKHVYNLTIRGGALEACVIGLKVTGGPHGTLFVDGACIESCQGSAISLLCYIHNTAITNCHFEANPYDIIIDGTVINTLLHHNFHFRHTNTAIWAKNGQDCTLMDSMFRSTQEPYVRGPYFQRFNVGRLVSTNAGDPDGIVPLEEPVPEPPVP